MPTPVPRQRALRNPHVETRLPRAANTIEHQIWLTSRLTERDRWIADMAHEHRVLTTQQITRLAFPSERSARARLRELFAWSVLDRFQPLLVSGSAPMHYVLGPAGATILAHQHGIEAKELGYRRDRALGIANSLRLVHQLGVNDLLTTLATTHGQQQLIAWWSENRCARHIGDLARPDAYAHLRCPAGELGCYVEYDTGTEALARLAAKLPGYHDLARSTACTLPVLLWFPTARREAHARRTLHAARSRLDHPDLVPLATASAEPSPDATGPVWLPLEDTRGPRRSLADLTSVWPQVTPPTLDDDPTPSSRATLPAPMPIAPGPHQQRGQ